MERKMLIQNSFYWVLYYAGTMFSANKVYTRAASCQVYPTEYAYEDNSVAEQESMIANCRRYPSGLQEGVSTEQYSHCDGTQLKLTDSDLGQGHYQISDYYVWSSGRAAQLLFIFPTRVSLTTITLHYYSDSLTGLPRLSFYAVPNDFDVWIVPTISNSPANVASVPPGGEPAGHRSVSININFNSKKLLMFKHSSTTVTRLALSEVQFFNNCNPLTTAVSRDSISTSPGTTVIVTTNQTSDSSSTATANNRSLTTYDSAVQNSEVNGAPSVTIFIGIGVAILIVLAAIVVVVTLVLLYLRKSSHPKAKSDYDNPYSTLCRGDTQQPQPHSQQPLTDLYDQIQLSPSTGQAEIVSKAEIQNTNTLSSHQTSASPNIDIDHCNKISGKVDVSTSEQQMYAAVNKIQKIMKGNETEQDQNNAAAVEKNGGENVLCSHSAMDKEDTKKKIKQREATPPSLHTTESPEALYSVVKKKPKADKEETVPPPPPHSLEELYTAVKKNVKGSTMEEEEGAPQIPPHTIEELYTAVMKKPKGDSATESETDGAPPIPPHTVDDL